MPFVRCQKGITTWEVFITEVIESSVIQVSQVWKQSAATD